MASMKSFLLAAAFCLTCVRAEVVDLQPVVSSTENSIQSAKTHVEHMLNLSPIPNEEKLAPIVKNESDHLAYEIKQFATSLNEKIAVGEHKPEIKNAVTAAVTQLNEAAASLEHVGSDLKQDNTKYYAAVEKVLHEAKNIVSAGPCDQLAPIVKSALDELTHDVNNYQYGIHELVGPHEGAPSAAGHVHEHGHHHVHQHHGGSSEESKESQESHEHHEHHHHHH